MMKQVGILIALIGSLGISSCQKCHKCQAKDQDGVVRYEYPEMCGSKKELSAYADECDTEYGAYNFTCECGETDL
ncbi:MAG: hypothetical protein R2813_08005 [Flavobacteriales bacterium]